MDEHPGDTLGKRFLTFWGMLGTIAAVALLVGAYRLVILPSNSAPEDGGAGNARWDIFYTTEHEQEEDYAKVAEVDPGKTVRLPAEAVLPYAVKVLNARKATPSAFKTPQAIEAEAAEKQKAGFHDPNLSIFDGPSQ